MTAANAIISFFLTYLVLHCLIMAMKVTLDKELNK